MKKIGVQPVKVLTIQLRKMFNKFSILRLKDMGADTYIIHVPEPCEQNWHQMLPGQDGRFCTHCKKTVIDFSGLSDGSMIALLEQNEGRLCGRFRTDQVNRVITAHAPVEGRRNRLKQAFAALLLLTTVRHVNAAGASVPHTVVEQQQNPVTARGTDNSDTALVHTLTGTVIDSADRDPIIYGLVSNKTNNLKQFTGADGKFSIDAAVGDVIEISYLGCKPYTFVVQGYTPQEYPLSSQSVRELGGAMVVTRKASLRYRIRRFFGMKSR